jgi:hypothetical protein
MIKSLKPLYQPVYLILLMSNLGVLVGCSNASKAGAKPPRKQFIISSRKYAAPDSYNRIYNVKSPAPIIAPKQSPIIPPLLLPSIQLSVTDGSLHEVARSLGRTMGYSYYCAPSLADRLITIDANGDIDTLAEMLAREENISIIVDHNHHSIQFLSRSE